MDTKYKANDHGAACRVNITFEGRSGIFIDGANPSFIRSLKGRLDEDVNYKQLIAYLKNSCPSVYDLQFLHENMFAIPVLFSRYDKENVSTLQRDA